MFCLNAWFSHSWLSLQPGLLKVGHVCSGNLGGLCSDLSSLPLSQRVADAEQRWVVSHPLDEHLIKSVSWASWDARSGSEELHLTISVEFSYGDWTFLYITALGAKTSPADTVKSSRGCDLKLWYYKGLLKAMSENVTSVDAPLLTSRCFCYLDWYWSGHAKTFTLPTVVTLESTCGLLLLLLWRL